MPTCPNCGTLNSENRAKEGEEFPCRRCGEDLKKGTRNGTEQPKAKSPSMKSGETNNEIVSQRKESLQLDET